MKKSMVLLLLIVGFIIGMGAGFVMGWRHRQFDLALQENKIAVMNLKLNGTNLCPEFREFLKARIYCNVYNYYPSERGYLLQKDWDFGPVDRRTLGTISAWKYPHQQVFDWEAASRGK
jgi:hypothetical protein